MRIKSLNDLPPSLRSQVEWSKGSVDKAHKYRNKDCVIDGMIFQSQLEGRCYEWLKLRQLAGDVLWFIRQAPFRLEGNVIYRADFLAVLAAGGVEVIDAKGYLLPESKNKLKQVKARYGVDVQLWNDGQRYASS